MYFQELRRLVAVAQADLVKFHLKVRRRPDGTADAVLTAGWQRVEGSLAAARAKIASDDAMAARTAALAETLDADLAVTNETNYSRRITCVGAFLDGVKAALESALKAA